MQFHDVSHDCLFIVVELCALKAWWRKPTAFPPACGSSSSPSKKTTYLFSYAVVDYGYSILLTSFAVVDFGYSICVVGVSFANSTIAQPINQKPFVSSGRKSSSS